MDRHKTLVFIRAHLQSAMGRTFQYMCCLGSSKPQDKAAVRFEHAASRSEPVSSPREMRGY